MSISILSRKDPILFEGRKTEIDAYYLGPSNIVLKRIIYG